MQTTELDKSHGFEWDKFRHDKRIVPHEQSALKSRAVVRIAAGEGVDAWLEKNLDFVTALRNSGKLKNLNQIAFLFRSVKNDRALRWQIISKSTGLMYTLPVQTCSLSGRKLKC